jgi:hypothetical protein
VFLVSSGCTCRPNSFLAPDEALVFFFVVYFSFLYITIITKGPTFVCPIEFQTFPVLMDVPNDVFQSEGQSLNGLVSSEHSIKTAHEPHFPEEPS